MTGYIVDASVAVEYLLRTPEGRRVEDIIRDRQLAAPEMLDAEILSILRRHVASEKLPTGRAETALRDAAAVPIRRVPHRDLLVTAWHNRHNVSAYDALYVAAAQLLDAPLLTADGRLTRAPNLGIAIHHVQLS
ncbi:type II toxin-antitoxin system VapC family toxin [Candidatus Poriferisodalis sp.]|uniref:type II toxin-antitoxin system VapC family toxin n=1 Tax=Candidatus Poriferisodalis sp. TaxID=3101277 RepID=UPI003B01541F